ncbi:hypothetical protein [Bradyrhizobium sp. USDA 10063]
MADIDDFATSLLEEAKRFLEKAQEAASDPVAHLAYLHAALMLGFCSLEAHVNAIADEFAGRPELSQHETGFLLERDVKLENGEFVLGGLRMSRLEDRLAFLHRRFSGKQLDTQAPWWGQLRGAITLRNKLTHPKDAQPISGDDVELSLQAIISTLDALYQAIYKRGFPVAGMGLMSRVTF